MNFKDYYSANIGEPVKKRHMHPIGLDPSSHPKSPGKFVPDMWKSDNNTVQEFEQLKKMNRGVKTINAAKAQKLKSLFKLYGSGKLGNTGISLLPHPSNNQQFILQK